MGVAVLDGTTCPCVDSTVKSSTGEVRIMADLHKLRREVWQAVGTALHP